MSLLDSDIILTTVKGKKEGTIPLKLIKGRPVMFVFQPGAGMPGITDMDSWCAAGLGGCTNELALHDAQMDAYRKLGIKVFIVNAMTVDQQKAAIDKKQTSDKVTFINDPDHRLAKQLNIHLRYNNGKCVYPPKTLILDANGNPDMLIDRKTYGPAVLLGMLKNQVLYLHRSIAATVAIRHRLKRVREQASGKPATEEKSKKRLKTEEPVQPHDGSIGNICPRLPSF